MSQRLVGKCRGLIRNIEVCTVSVYHSASHEQLYPPSTNMASSKPSSFAPSSLSSSSASTSSAISGATQRRQGNILGFMNPQISSYFIAGGIAGAASRTVVSPLERLKIIQCASFNDGRMNGSKNVFTSGKCSRGQVIGSIVVCGKAWLECGERKDSGVL